MFKKRENVQEIEEGNREYKISLDYSNTKPSCINKILNTIPA